MRRSDGRERVREALRRLGEIGSPTGIIARTASELGTSSDFDLVLVSRVEGDALRPQTIYSQPTEPAADALLEGLQRRPLPLRYPLLEHEVADRQRATIADVRASGPRASQALVEVLAWRSYALAPIVIEGRSVGLLHAACVTRMAPVDEIDLELAALYADGLGRAFERAVLRDQLLRQRVALQSATRWMTAGALALRARPAVQAPRSLAEDQLGDLLTTRELEVMERVAEGESNREIAAALMLGEGTVKYHVKNILRKLHARGRTEAISRFIQLRGASEGR